MMLDSLIKHGLLFVSYLHSSDKVVPYNPILDSINVYEISGDLIVIYAYSLFTIAFWRFSLRNISTTSEQN